MGTAHFGQILQVTMPASHPSQRRMGQVVKCRLTQVNCG